MQVAVTDVAIPDHFEIRIVFFDDRIDISQKCWHFRDSDRDIVFVGCPVRDGFGDVLAQFPQVLQLLLALTHHTVEHPTLFHAVLKRGQGRVSHFFSAGFKLQQGIERARGIERRGNIATAHDLGQGLVGKEFEGGQVELVAKRVKHRHDRVEIRGAEHHRRKVVRRTIQTHRRLDHKAQGSFRTDEQLTQVVACGVLDQVLVQLQQIASTGNHLQASDPVAGHAIANNLNTTGIGADIAANLTRTCRGEVHGVVQAFIFCKVL
ncbi:hypothetical protein D3C81_1258860 [compost metagenome]